MDFQMVSYADNFEDVLLRRAFPTDAPGFYIDVGAYDPVEFSVTKHFYDRGWRGINIEPNPAPFARLRDARDRDINLNIGLSDSEGSLTLYEAPSAGCCWSVDREFLAGWSTKFETQLGDLIERTISVSTLAQVCNQHVPAGVEIDFLKVDVEGHEAEVIAGGDWDSWRPRIVLIESTNLQAWEPRLVGAGYLFAFFDGVNRFFVREEDRGLIPELSVPANPGDRFLIHGYLARIAELEHRQIAQEAESRRLLEPYQDLGPLSLGIARRINRMSRRYPRTAAVVRSILRRGAG
jgi:FkbM family methyltransferase